MAQLTSHIDTVLEDFRGQHLYVATSGGVDSMTLLWCLKKLNFNITALHVNYHLRGDESNLDEGLVAEFCSENDIPFIVKHIDLNELLEKGGNLQALARETRYSWFNELLTQKDNGVICLGHHANDQVETFLLNLSRNSGVMGLAAMPFRRGRYIRPLLSFWRSEISEFAKSNSIPWREDRSNASNKYRRNFIRNEILPFVESKIPDFSQRVLVLIEQFQIKQQELEQKINRIVLGVNNHHVLVLNDYADFDDFEKIELLRQLDIPASLLSEIDKLVKSQKGKSITIPQSEHTLYREIIREKDRLAFVPNKQEKTMPTLTIHRVSELPRNFSKDIIYLDKNKLKGELKLRKWKVGDRMKPVGLAGSKLISDILTDSKINATERQDVFVLTDNESIHWCVGYKIGREAIADNTSTEILECGVTY